MAAPRRAPAPRGGRASTGKGKTNRLVVVGIAAAGVVAVLILLRMSKSSPGGPGYGTTGTATAGTGWLGQTTATSASGGGATIPPVPPITGNVYHPKPKRKLPVPLAHVPHPVLHPNRLL